MPYKKILLNAFIGFIHDKVVWINAGLLLIVNMEIVEWIKIYALILGAAYTTYKFYKEVINEMRWWKSFKAWNAAHYTLIRAMLDVARQKKERDNKL